MRLKKQSSVKDWFIFETVYGEKVLCGELVGEDPRYDPETTAFAAGHHIVTSPIQQVKDNEIITMNTIYNLVGPELVVRNDYWKQRIG